MLFVSQQREATGGNERQSRKPGATVGRGHRGQHLLHRREATGGNRRQREATGGNPGRQREATGGNPGGPGAT